MSGDLWPPIGSKDDAVEGSTAKTRPVAKRLGFAAIVVVLGIGALVSARSLLANQPPPAATAAPPPPEVTVSTPLSHRMASWTTFTGQFSAVDRVELRAQVNGYLTEIHFVDGQLVKKGDLLFVIDPRPYQIALEQARAGLQTAQAGLELADQQLNRTTELKRSDFASVETLDQRVQQKRAAVAALEQAKAAVRSAELNLEFTHISAPISGRISSHRVSIGNLIIGGQLGATPTLLTTIVSLDPIYLDFDMSESDYLAFQRFLQSQHGATATGQAVDASLGDEEGWKHHGVLDFVDNELDRSSGTIHSRASIPNSDLVISPGEFARLRLPMSANREVLLVPDAAVAADQSRKIVMTVSPEGKVVPKMVEIGDLAGETRVIKSGITATDKVIINGLMRARPGSTVTPKQGTIKPPAEG